MWPKETELPWLRIRDSRSENARKTVAVLRLGWTPVKGPRRDRDQKSTSTARASSFQDPQGRDGPTNPESVSAVFRGKGQGARSELPPQATRSTALQLHRTTKKWRLPPRRAEKDSWRSRHRHQDAGAPFLRWYTRDHAKPCGNGCPHYPAHPEPCGSLCLPYLPRYAPNTKTPRYNIPRGREINAGRDYFIR